MPRDKIADAELDRLFEMYLPKLLRLAENRIAERFKSKFDSGDIAGTVCRTIVRRISEGKFSFEDDAGFWRLLVTIAKRKISNKVRHFSTGSRSVDKEISEAANSIIKSPEPGPDEAAAFAELLHNLLDQLDEQEQKIFLMRTENHQFQEIADELGVAERTPRRKMKVIKEKLLEIFEKDQPTDWDRLNSIFSI